MRAALVAIALWLGMLPALAANPSEQLDDPALEARARELSKELRCLVCQNQSIDDSDAELAKDLRVLVRERLVEGDTDDEILAYLTDRYGAFVRLRPPLTASTLALWITPFVVVVFALVGAGVYVHSRRAAPAGAAPLSEGEEVELNARLSDLKGRDP